VGDTVQTSVLCRLGLLMVRSRWAVIALWVILFVGSAPLFSRLPSVLTSGFGATDTEAQVWRRVSGWGSWHLRRGFLVDHHRTGPGVIGSGLLSQKGSKVCGHHRRDADRDSEHRLVGTLGKWVCVTV